MRSCLEISLSVYVEKLLSSRATPSAVRLAGGVANSDTWVQSFADVLQLPIEIISTRELGAMGCAMAAIVAIGIFQDFKEAAKSLVRIKIRVEPNLTSSSVYKQKYDHYKQVSTALECCW